MVLTKKAISEMENEFPPRNYQIMLMEMALKKNIIVYLPTGSGKTYIAVMILQRIGGQHCHKPLHQGGKLCIMLVNTVNLVDQHSAYLRKFTPFEVGAYSGDIGVDNWSQQMWEAQFEKHQVLVMTSQILVNIVQASILNLKDVALLIFDECHRGVNDQPMRQIMLNFQKLSDPPRVIGLTATLLNRNCKPHQVADEVKALEITFHSQVATVDELESILGFSTNPKEIVRVFRDYQPTTLELQCDGMLNELQEVLVTHLPEKTSKVPPKANLIALENEPNLNEIIRIIKDVRVHINMLGVYGARLTIIAHIIQLERLRKNCCDSITATILDSVMTTFCYIKRRLSNVLDVFPKKEQVYEFSSPQVLLLLDIIRDYKKEPRNPLCGIIFVQRRFTAKILYYLLLEISKCDSDFNYIKPNYVVGSHSNPFNDTREGLYSTKMQRKVMMQFANNEINLLIASNVIEEGIDIPLCTFVAKFDKPMDYRSYIQSKGRARHRNSLYYLMVNDSERDNFLEKYETFQEIERTLNTYLIGQNENRKAPSQQTIQSEFYEEMPLPPYYVAGPDSAHVTMVSAISLLGHYCMSLSSDKYTTLVPNWYLSSRNQVVIELPTICPILDPIYGPPMMNKKLAKRAAALKAIEVLHKAGELDDQLLPKPLSAIEDNLNDFFIHWPETTEKEAGYKNNRRIHDTQIPEVCQGVLQPKQPLYLHIIQLKPTCVQDLLETKSDMMMYDMYTSSLCYGILTAKRWPKLCQFSVHVTLSELTVDIEVNKLAVVLTEEEIHNLKLFHCLIFNDVLKLLRPFLLLDNDESCEGLLVVPIQKSDFSIDFDVIENNRNLNDEESVPRHKLPPVTRENYLGKIVSPTYRQEDKHYLVTDVCEHLNAYSQFPSNEYDCYKSYYREKYQKTLIHADEPLLLVKGLSQRLNLLKPRSIGTKRDKKRMFENMEEHLISELCIKQDFPACLWIQANLLPSILHRINYLLCAEQLLKKINNDCNLEIRHNGDREWKPLEVDPYLIHYEFKKSPSKEDTSTKEEEERDADIVVSDVPNEAILQLKQDFEAKKLELEYPWLDKDEPIDIERNFDVTLMDIHDYEQFIHEKVTPVEKMHKCNATFNKNILPITFDKQFIEKRIELLSHINVIQGPELADIYKALATAKSNDIVNLERLETLGDSFLKIAISLFIILKYPKYSEGKATSLKNKLISNKNLYYVGATKNLGGCIKVSEFAPSYEWKPPYFCVPRWLRQNIDENRMELVKLLKVFISNEERMDGVLNPETKSFIVNNFFDVSKEEICDKSANVVDSLLGFVNKRNISDKTVSDCVEALIGVYFKSCGLRAGLKLIEWLGIIPQSEDMVNLLDWQPADPLLNCDATIKDINYHLPLADKIEDILGYKFRNRAYLLQALTHCSYTQNRLTYSYERLEFLGDAILDFLITCHIFETSDNLTPGELTDLRSALVNNITFAAFTVRCGFHKYFLFCNKKLSEFIGNFVEYQESRNFVIDDAILILLEEDELQLAEHIDVPKVLGDVFEALAGAIFLDSGMDLNIVWSIFYKIMWREIDMFRADVPKSAVRKLHESGTYPNFHMKGENEGGRTMVELNFMLRGDKKRVYGFGENKTLAKRAAAKLALRLLH